MRSAHRGRSRPPRSRPEQPPDVPPAPEWDLSTTFSVARIEPDPSRPSGRLLFLGGIECSYVDLADPRHLEFSYIRRIADLVDLFRPARAPIEAVHIGGGGCTLPRYVAATRPRSRQVVYEKDSGLIELARRYLGLRTSPTLRVRIGDARARLAERAAGSIDLVVGDAFDGVVVPAHLATLEFARDVLRVLRPDGVYALNIIDCPPLRVSRTAAATLLAVFPHLLLVTAADLLRERDAGNVVLLASTSPLPVAALRRAAGRGPLPDLVLERPEVVEFAADARPLPDAETDRWLAAAPPPDLPVPAFPQSTSQPTSTQPTSAQQPAATQPAGPQPTGPRLVAPLPDEPA
jgi:SAM-dependent methyltransferase